MQRNLEKKKFFVKDTINRNIEEKCTKFISQINNGTNK